MIPFLDTLLKKKEEPEGAEAAAPSAFAKSIDAGALRPVRIAFMGTPELSAHFLSALLENGYPVVGVVTQPDRPAGRKLAVEESPVKKVAAENRLPVLAPAKLDAAFLEAFQDWKADLVIVVAYGKILPPEILGVPALGCLNIHASLLPRWRGASPIQNALLSGDTETGVTLMQMNAGMDTGPLIAQKKIPIAPEDTAEVLRKKISEAGRTLLLEALPLWIEGKITPVPQNEDEATLCQLIERNDGRIVWSESAESIYNRYRALFPWPGVFTFWKKNDALMRLKFLHITFQKQSPQMKYGLGEVFELGEKIGVKTGEGVVFLETVQLEGKGPLPIKEFLAGSPDLVGSVFH